MPIVSLQWVIQSRTSCTVLSPSEVFEMKLFYGLKFAFYGFKNKKEYATHIDKIEVNQGKFYDHKDDDFYPQTETHIVLPNQPENNLKIIIENFKEDFPWWNKALEQKLIKFIKIGFVDQSCK